MTAIAVITAITIMITAKRSFALEVSAYRLLFSQVCHDSSAVGGCGVLYDEVDGYVCGLAGRRSPLLPARSQTGCDQAT